MNEGFYRTVTHVVGIDRHGVEVTLEPNSVVWVTHVEGVSHGQHPRIYAWLLDEFGRLDPGRVQVSANIDPRNPWLITEPGVVDWPHGMQQLAQGQGWDIFLRDEPNEGEWWQLDALDESDQLPHNRAAWLHVWKRATVWEDFVCKQALAFLYVHAPKEYRRIRDVGFGGE
jgi:hypothetical protein